MEEYGGEFPKLLWDRIQDETVNENLENDSICFVEIWSVN